MEAQPFVARRMSFPQYPGLKSWEVPDYRYTVRKDGIEMLQDSANEGPSVASITGRTALVTGASGGIGREIARSFGNEGMQVAVNYCHGEPEATDLAEGISKGEGEAKSIQADVSKEQEVEALIDQTRDTFGHVDVLVNNAGIAHPTSARVSMEE